MMYPMSSHAPVRFGIAAAAVMAAGLWGATPPAAADNPVCTANVCSFYSPSHKISCEIDYQRGMQDTTYCQIGPSQPQSVRMDPSGAFSVCTGESCLGNPGLGQATLAYGQTAGIGPFTCVSEVSGVTCRVTSGRGFTISSSGVTPTG
jgi:hypothetical protein